ncbi:Rab GTPase activating protein [Entamoeba marina]
MSLEDYLMKSNLLEKKVLCDFAKNGLPERHRSLVWKVLCGYLPETKSLHSSKQKIKKKEYINLVNYHFNNTKSKYPGAWKNIISRISVVWSFENADILFFQGLLDWVSILILPFLFEHVSFSEAVGYTDLDIFTPKWLLKVETDTYFCLCCILDKYQHLLSGDFAHIFNAVDTLQNIIGRHYPQLNEFILNYPDLYLTSTRSFICPFTRNFNPPQLFTVFDALMSTDMFHAMFYFVACIFTENSDIITADDDIIEVMQAVQTLPTKTWSSSRVQIYISNALMLYYNDIESMSTIFEPMSKKVETPTYLKPKTSQLTLKQLPLLNDIAYGVFRYTIALVLMRFFVSLITIVVTVVLIIIEKKRTQKEN